MDGFDNITWIFSGIGITFLSVIRWLVKHFREKKFTYVFKPKQSTDIQNFDGDSKEDNMPKTDTLELQYDSDILSYDYLKDTPEKGENEEFAALLLKNDIILSKKRKEICMKVNINNVEQVVVSNEGKTKLRNRYVKNKINELLILDWKAHQFLIGKSSEKYFPIKTLEPYRLPFRWASGGVLSVVKYKGNTWIPLFFRDIAPCGWNIALGSSERDFDNSFYKFDEIINPKSLLTREFAEEILITKSPKELSNNNEEIFYYPFSFSNYKSDKFFGKHKELRSSYDHKILIADPEDTISVENIKTRMKLLIENDVINPAGNGYLLCVDYDTLGIEIVEPLFYDLDELGTEVTILDGEIINKTSQLARMPVYLFSLNFLEKHFKNITIEKELNDGKKQKYLDTTEGQVFRYYEKIPQKALSLELVINKIPEEDVFPFEWDLIRREYILNNPEDGVIDEKAKEEYKYIENKRYVLWKERFSENFQYSNNKIMLDKVSKLFTPATVKILNLFFNNADYEKYLIRGGSNSEKDQKIV